MNHRANKDFRLRVFPFDRSHDSASLFRRKHISHNFTWLSSIWSIEILRIVVQLRVCGLSCDISILHFASYLDFNDVSLITGKLAMQRLQEADFCEAMTPGRWIVARVRHCLRQKVDTWRRNFPSTNGRRSAWIRLDPWAGSTRGVTQHIPYDNAVDNLLAVDYLGTESCMYTRPCIVCRVRPRILAERPNDKFFGVWRSFKNVGVVAVKAPLCFDDTNPAVWHADFVVMPLAGTAETPTCNCVAFLQIVENILHELTFGFSGGCLSSTNSFDCASKYP